MKIHEIAGEEQMAMSSLQRPGWRRILRPSPVREDSPLMDVAVFLKTWLGSAGAERANKDSFLKDLCDVLGVSHPTPKTGDPAGDTYVFERDAITPRAGETTTTKFIDLYKEDCFLLEAKQGSTAVSPKLGTARRDTPGWTFAMKEAYGQALGYARTFDNPPPFVIVVDLGHCFDLYASFGRVRLTGLSLSCVVSGTSWGLEAVTA